MSKKKTERTMTMLDLIILYVMNLLFGGYVGYLFSFECAIIVVMLVGIIQFIIVYWKLR